MATYHGVSRSQWKRLSDFSFASLFIPCKALDLQSLEPCSFHGRKTPFGGEEMAGRGATAGDSVSQASPCCARRAFCLHRCAQTLESL